MSPAKYREYTPVKPTKKYDIHPVWRGVGFAFIILIPIMAYAAMDILLKENAKRNVMPIPLDMLAKPGDVLYALIPDPMLYIKIILFIFVAFFMYLLFVMFATIVTRITMGDPMKADPYYVPQMAMPKNRRVRR